MKFSVFDRKKLFNFTFLEIVKFLGLLWYSETVSFLFVDLHIHWITRTRFCYLTKMFDYWVTSPEKKIPEYSLIPDTYADIRKRYKEMLSIVPHAHNSSTW